MATVDYWKLLHTQIQERLATEAYPSDETTVREVLLEIVAEWGLVPLPQVPEDVWKPAVAKAVGR